MKEIENKKADMEQNKLLTLAKESDDYKKPLPADEDEDFFPELTKEFNNLPKESETTKDGFENRFVLSATDFLKNLALTAFDLIEKRVHTTYNERIEVQNVLYKVIYENHEKSINSIQAAINLNKESAIAIQSIIPQLRKIIQVYNLPLKNKRAWRKMTKGSWLLGKIEEVQEIIARFDSEPVDSKIFMNYESNLISAYILAKRIEEEDSLFIVRGLSANIERVCEVLEPEKDITPLLTMMLPTMMLYSFFEDANYIYINLNKEASSIHRATAALINHLRSERLPKRNEQKETQNKHNQELIIRAEDIQSIIKAIHSEGEKTRAHVSKESEGIKENSKEVAQQAGVQIEEARAQANWPLEKIAEKYVKTMGFDNSYTAAMFCTLILKLSDKQDPQTGEWIKGETYKQAAEELTKSGHPISDSTLCEKIHRIEDKVDRKLVTKMPRGMRSTK